MGGGVGGGVQADASAGERLSSLASGGRTAGANTTGGRLPSLWRSYSLRSVQSEGRKHRAGRISLGKRPSCQCKLALGVGDVGRIITACATGLDSFAVNFGS